MNDKLRWLSRVIGFLSLLVFGSPIFAATPTISETLTAAGVSTGVDAAITALAGVIAAVVLGYLGFKLVRIAMRWASRLGG